MVLSKSQIRYAWATCNSAGAMQAHQNCGSCVKNSTGNYTVTFSDSFVTDRFFTTVEAIGSGTGIAHTVISKTTTSVTFQFTGSSVVILGMTVWQNSAADPPSGFSVFCCE